MWRWFNSHANCAVLEPAGELLLWLLKWKSRLLFATKTSCLGFYHSTSLPRFVRWEANNINEKKTDFYNTTHLYLWSFPLSSCDCFKVVKQNGIFSFLYKSFLCIGFGDIILVISGWFVIWEEKGPKVRLREMQWNFDITKGSRTSKIYSP